MGQLVSSRDGSSLQVFSYSEPVSSTTSKPAPGTVFGVADVQGCAGASGGDGQAPANFALRLVYGTQIGPRAPVKDPAFLLMKLAPHKCSRGYVSFEVPEAINAVEVLYLGPNPVGWTVP